MPIEVTWGNPEKTYTVFKFIGTWTWDEYYGAIKKGAELIEPIPYKVNILLDMEECRLFPGNLLSHSASTMRQPPRSFDLAVVVSETSFVRILVTILDRLFSPKGTHFRIAATRAEAEAIFHTYDKAQPAQQAR
jgi:hypothetical protein